MKTRKFGRSGLTVSAMGQGCMGMSGKVATSRAEAAASDHGFSHCGSLVHDRLPLPIVLNEELTSQHTSAA